MSSWSLNAWSVNAWGSNSWACSVEAQRSAWRYWVNEREFRRKVTAKDIERYDLVGSFKSIDEALDYLKQPDKLTEPAKKNNKVKIAQNAYKNTLNQISIDTPEFDLSAIRQSADSYENYYKWARDARRVLEAYAYFLWQQEKKRDEDAILTLLLAA